VSVKRWGVGDKEMSMANFYQSKTGDVFRVRFDADPRGMGGVWIEKWLFMNGETHADTMARAAGDDDETEGHNDWLGIPADICHAIGEELMGILGTRYEDSR